MGWTDPPTCKSCGTKCRCYDCPSDTSCRSDCTRNNCGFCGDCKYLYPTLAHDYNFKLNPDAKPFYPK